MEIADALPYLTAALATYGAGLSTYNAIRANRPVLLVTSKCGPPFNDIIVRFYNPGDRKFQIRAASIGYGKHPNSCVRLTCLDDMAGFVLDPGTGKEVTIPADSLRAVASSWESQKTRGGWLWVTVAGFGRYEVNVSTDVDARIAHPDGTRLALGEGDFNGQLPTASLLGLTYEVIYKPTIGVVMK